MSLGYITHIRRISQFLPPRLTQTPPKNLGRLRRPLLKSVYSSTGALPSLLQGVTINTSEFTLGRNPELTLGLYSELTLYSGRTTELTLLRVYCTTELALGRILEPILGRTLEHTP